MFKRMHLFMFLIFSFTLLIGCNSETISQPEDVRDDIWEATNNIYDEIISYYNGKKEYNEVNTKQHSKFLYDKYYRDSSLTSREEMLIDQLTTLATQTKLLGEGSTIDDLKNLSSYDYELELEVAKQLLNR